MDTPDDRKYAKEHEWALVEPDGTVRVGITEFAQDELGDVVYVELPSIGDKVLLAQKMGEIESVKTVSDLYSPVTGVVLEVNGALLGTPELVNQEPYEKGWMVRVRAENAGELDGLLNAAQYDGLFGEH